MASRELPALMRDRANLLLAASLAGEQLAARCDNATGPIITLTVDEARELAEQFQRITALMSLVHIEEANALHRASERAVA